MKKLVCIIAILIFFCSCTTVEFISIDVRQPAPVTFKPGTKKILIVDNSFKQNTSDSISMYGNPIELTNFLLDSIRPLLVNTIAWYMNEEGIYDTVEVYPYYPKPLYLYYQNDSLLELPLTKEEVLDICYNTESDALISLDFVGIELDAPFGEHLSSNIGTVIRCYSADGDTLAMPMARMDSLISLGGFVNMEDELLGLVTQNTINAADMWVNSFIPKWEREERALFVGYADAQRATSMADNGFWKGAYYIWAELFNKEKDKNKKIKYAANAALASECSDDIYEAQKWINAANDLLLEMKKNDGGLAKYIRNYKEIIDKRVEKAPVLIRQLGLEEE